MKPIYRRRVLLALLVVLIFLYFYWRPTSSDETEVISVACRRYVCDATTVQRAQANKIEGYALDVKYGAVLRTLCDLSVPVLPATQLRSEKPPPLSWGPDFYFDTISGKRVEPLQARASFIGPVVKVQVASAGGGMDSLSVKLPFVGWRLVHEAHFSIVY